MKRKVLLSLGVGVIAFMITSCCQRAPKEEATKETNDAAKELVDMYTDFTLTSNIDHLSANEKEMLKILFEAADIMNGIFWKQTYGDKESLMAKVEDPYLRQFVEINYGPWNRLNNNKPFIDGVGKKPAGAHFYPTDMTKEEFEAWDNDNKLSQYTMIVRDEEGNLKSVWYHEYFKEETEKVAKLLKEAAVVGRR
jgi:hypothetical protein